VRRLDVVGWLRCYWHFIAFGLGVLASIWLVRGFVVPFSFDAQSALRVASSEKALARSQATVAREAPGGKRGFYRSGRVAVASSGDYVRDPKRAVIVVEAGPGGSNKIQSAAGLERKDARTNKWVDVSAADFSAGLLPRAVYRVADLYLKWE
jgi:hypothetical protein